MVVVFGDAFVVGIGLLAIVRDLFGIANVIATGIVIATFLVHDH